MQLDYCNGVLIAELPFSFQTLCLIKTLSIMCKRPGKKRVEIEKIMQ